MRNVAAILLLWFAGSTAARAGDVRCLFRTGDTLWAAGSHGLLMRSADGGDHWQAVRMREAGHFEALSGDGSAVLAFGGRAIHGMPEGLGLPLLVRAEPDANETTRPTAPALGWLRGGILQGKVGAVFGQPTYAIPSGLAKTQTGGNLWTAVDTTSPGPLLGGAFPSWRLGYVVGTDHRVLSIRALRQPKVHPPQIRSSLPLRAIATGGDLDFWAVGDNSSILRSKPGDAPWVSVKSPLPAGAERMGDFETVVACEADSIHVAGGLTGAIARTTDGGSNWKLLPAPTPGPIHSLLRISDDTMLAAGDAGRIWKTTDACETWTLLTGSKSTDVLFVCSATDLSIWPAVAAHTSAGCSVAVVFASAPPATDRMPSDQLLRACAYQAGATGVTVLRDFVSPTLTRPGSRANEKQILRAWKARLDEPPEKELTRQIAATIRLYRPKVLAVGPSGEATPGPRSEARLISRLAQKAVDLAGRSDEKLLASVLLKPHTPDRVFVGSVDNDRWHESWAKVDAGLVEKPSTSFRTDRFPAGESTSLEMLALDAAWMLPHAPMTTARPPWLNAYVCTSDARRTVRPLFTTGLTSHRLSWKDVSDERQAVSSASRLKAAIALDRTATVLTHLAPLAKKIQDDPLPADRLYLAWMKLWQEGNFSQALQARSLYLRHGQDHPLYGRAMLMAVGTDASSEWRAQRARTTSGPAMRGLDFDLGKALQLAGRKGHWLELPEVLALETAARRAEGRLADAANGLAKLETESYCPHWRRYAALLGGKEDPLMDRIPSLPSMEAVAGGDEVKIDGRFREKAWTKAKRVRLAPTDGNAIDDVQATARCLRTSDALVMGLQLKHKDRRVWTLRITLDGDRDAWTALAVQFSSDGARSAELIHRWGPAASVDRKVFDLQGRKTGGRLNVEVEIPFSQLGLSARSASIIGIQMRATAWDSGRESVLQLVPGVSDPSDLHRLGLLHCPAAE